MSNISRIKHGVYSYSVNDCNDFDEVVIDFNEWVYAYKQDNKSIMRKPNSYIRRLGHDQYEYRHRKRDMWVKWPTEPIFSQVVCSEIETMYQMHLFDQQLENALA